MSRFQAVGGLVGEINARWKEERKQELIYSHKVYCKLPVRDVAKLILFTTLLKNAI
jgi:hypothetical protein